MSRRYTPEIITELEDNEIFVFGSNLAGMHGGGAARVAYNKFGAVQGPIFFSVSIVDKTTQYLCGKLKGYGINSCYFLW